MIEDAAIRRSLLPSSCLFDYLYIFKPVGCGDDEFFFTSNRAAECFSLILVERRHGGFGNFGICASPALGDGPTAAE